MSIAFDEIDIEAPIDKWINPFLLEIVFHLDYTEVIPKIIDSIGSKLLNKSKFWVLYSRYKVAEAIGNEKKQVLLTIVDNACLHKLDNKKLLYDYFVLMIRLYFTSEKVKIYLSKKMKLNISDQSIQNKDYSYLLKNGQYFRNVTDYTSAKKSFSVYDKYVMKSIKDNGLQKNDRFYFLGTKHERYQINKGCEEVMYINDM